MRLPTFRDVLLASTGPLLIGFTLGILGAWATSRLFASLMFGIEGTEGWLYLAVSMTLSATCLLATWLPARGAARLDPLVVLRAE